MKPSFDLYFFAGFRASTQPTGYARNPKTTVQKLEFLLKNTKHNEILVGLIENPNTPAAAIEQKTIDLIQNITSTKGIQNEYSNIFCLLDARVPLKILLNFQNPRTFWVSRYAVAINKKVPLDILHNLAKDKHDVVKLAAQKTIQSLIDNPIP